MERTQVPADMQLELFASEPDIMKPIAFAWDERGRLWVAETRDYPHGVTPSGEGNDDIKICEDTDGDGKADKFTIFADHLNLPTSLDRLRQWRDHRRAAAAVAFPQVEQGRRPRGHARGAHRGWGIGDTHAQANNLHYGYDNWLYGCVGYSGFEGVVGGKMHEFTMGTYRFTAGRQRARVPAPVHEQLLGRRAPTRRAIDFGGTANNAPIFFGGIPADRRSRGACGR